jgi:competence protein ComEC
VSYVPAPDEEDCRRAAVIVATRDEPPDCAATVIGRSLWRERGALAMRRDGGAGFIVKSTRPPNFDRPWAPRPPRAASSDTAASLPRTAISAPPRDATPHPDDLSRRTIEWSCVNPPPEKGEG